MSSGLKCELKAVENSLELVDPTTQRQIASKTSPFTRIVLDAYFNGKMLTSQYCRLCMADAPLLPSRLPQEC
jgi:hypothetical protein